MYQVGERVYDPAQGRFLQQDPLSEGEGDWTYAGNNPADGADPSGMAVARSSYPHLPPFAWRPHGGNGPDHPINDLTGKEIRWACTGDDSLAQLSEKIDLIQEIIRRHKAWNRFHGRDDAHDQEINNAMSALSKCSRLKRDKLEEIAAGGSALASGLVALYWILSEGSRVLFPPRNLVPVF